MTARRKFLLVAAVVAAALRCALAWPTRAGFRRYLRAAAGLERSRSATARCTEQNDALLQEIDSAAQGPGGAGARRRVKSSASSSPGEIVFHLE